MNKIQLYNVKIIGLYFIGLLSLGIYFYIDSAVEINAFLTKADRVRSDWSLGFYTFFGFIKLVSLTVGITISLGLTFIIIRNRIKKK